MTVARGRDIPFTLLLILLLIIIDVIEMIVISLYTNEQIKSGSFRVTVGEARCTLTQVVSDLICTASVISQGHWHTCKSCLEIQGLPSRSKQSNMKNSFICGILILKSNFSFN